MASLTVEFLLFLCLLSGHVRAQLNHSNVISLGSSLSPNAHGPASWLSPSGIFAFGFYPHGNGFALGIWLVGQPENTIVWTANRDEPPVSSNAMLHLTTDGKLHIRTEKGIEKPVADVPGPAGSAAMLDSGNFVLYDKNHSVIWESFDFPSDTILGGQNLSFGEQLVSSVSSSDHSSGRFFLNMQMDGNLVAYPVNSSGLSEDAYWASGIAAGVYSVYLSLDYRGHLSLRSRGSNIHILENSSYNGTQRRIIYRATLDADGIFKLYSHHYENNTSSSMLLEWSVLDNQCEVKGFCGFNSYCSRKGAKGDCYCYPGFIYVNQSNKFLGCSDYFTDDGCGGRKDLLMLYNVTALENVWWGDNPYSLIQMKKADCGKSCQEDCNCGAVLYTGETCNKYKLPLRYGRRSQNISSTAFFKVIMKSAGTYSPQIPVIPTIVTGKDGLLSIFAICLGTITGLCSVLAIFSFFIYKHRVNSYRKLTENGNLGLIEEFTLRSFAYNELEKATDDFKEELGRGSFGAVYKGIISGSNKAVAVKRLENVVEEGEREFRAEMTAIGRTHHRNLVRLLGFCVEGSRKLLVYEYMSNGSLADILFKAEMRPIWKERVRIALDVAKGVLYLHEECEVHIIHCNLKPQNILMDDFLTAKISDFGLAKLLMPSRTENTTEIRGTTGYLAPEWQNSALISVQADVYSFGVVLLEIICCRSNIEVNVSTADEIILSSWVYNCFVAGQLDKLVEDENVDWKTMERMVKVGLLCIQDDPTLRPSMRNVILMLEGTIDVAVPPSPVLSFVSQ